MVACGNPPLVCAGVLFVLCFVVLLISIIVPIVGLKSWEEQVQTNLVAARQKSPNDADYSNWLYSGEPDDSPVWYAMTFFDLTNDAEVKTGGAMKIDQKGPYWYQIMNKKHSVKFETDSVTNKETYTYGEHEWYVYNADKTKAESPSKTLDPQVDQVTLPNIAYIAGMGVAQTEFNLKNHLILAPLLGGVLQDIQPKVCLTIGVTDPQSCGLNFLNFWGNFFYPSTKPSLETSPLATYSYGAFTLKFFSNPAAIGASEAIFGAPAPLSATQTLNLIFGGNPVTPAVPGLLSQVPKDTKNLFLQQYIGKSGAGIFVSLWTQCRGQNNNFAPLPGSDNSDPCTLILLIWPNVFTDNVAPANQGWREIAWVGLYLTLTVNKYVDGQMAKGSLFSSKTVNNWLMDVSPDPIWGLLGKKTMGANLLCNDMAESTNATDPCSNGFTTKYTGADDPSRINYMVASRSMRILPKQKGNSCSGIKYCSPLVDCAKQDAGVWPGMRLIVGGYSPNNAPRGSRNSFKWKPAVEVGYEFELWSGTLMRTARMVCREKSMVQGIDTLRCYADLQNLARAAIPNSAEDAPDQNYGTLIKGMLDRSVLSGGLPVQAATNNFVGLTKAELGRFINLDQQKIKTLDGCIIGEANCDYSTRESDYNVFIDIEPKTGAALRVHERITTMFLISNYKDGAYANMVDGPLPNGMLAMPVLMADKQSEIRPDKADKLKKALAYTDMFQNLFYAGVSLGAIGSAASMVWIIVLRKKSSGDSGGWPQGG